ncbi:hypothetical protein [Halostagnicola bangensis]
MGKKPTKITRRKGIKATIGTVSGMAVFSNSASAQSQSELESDLKEAYGRKEGKILYNVIQDKQDLTKNQSKRSMRRSLRMSWNMKN